MRRWSGNLRSDTGTGGRGPESEGQPVPSLIRRPSPQPHAGTALSSEITKTLNPGDARREAMEVGRRTEHKPTTVARQSRVLISYTARESARRFDLIFSRTVESRCGPCLHGAFWWWTRSERMEGADWEPPSTSILDRQPHCDVCRQPPCLPKPLAASPSLDSAFQARSWDVRICLPFPEQPPPHWSPR